MSFLKRTLSRKGNASVSPAPEAKEHNFSKVEVEEFRVAFDLFDADKSGSISIEELGTAMRSLGQRPTPKDLQRMMRDVDEDGNEEINFEEFLIMMHKQQQFKDSDEDIAEMFKFFDTDGSGYVTATKLRLAMKSLGETFTDEEIEGMITEADLNGDSRVDIGEFSKMMREN